MTLSSEALKYRDDFVKASKAASEAVAVKEYKNDLELIKEVNKAIEAMKMVREKHVRA